MNDLTQALLGMTTGICFKLYPCDPYDKIICDAIQKHYKTNSKTFTISIDDLREIFDESKEISDIIDYISNQFDNEETIQINTIIFIESLLETYPNLKTMSLRISDESFQRITPNDGEESDSYNFYLDVESCVFSLGDFFDRTGIEIVNKELIKNGYLNNNYLERQSYIHISWEKLSEVLINAFAIMNVDSDGFISSVSEFFGTPEETTITLITDYTIY